MRFLIRTWVRQGGQNVPRDREVEAERLRIGRGTDQDIELPDLRIAVAHAELVRSGRNAVIAAKPGASMLVNEIPVNEHKLHGGDVIVFGRYQLTVTPGTGNVDLQIDVEEKISAREDKARRQTRYRTTLGDAGLSRRWPSWLLFWAVLAVGLAIPAWLRFGHAVPPPAATTTAAPAKAAAVAALTPTDQLWLPGRFSSAHAYFQKDCGKCHQVAFRQVRNEACLGCHQDTAQHVDDPHLLLMPEFAQARCEDCHHEHKGDAGLVARHDAQCADCHAQPQLRFASAKLEPAADFSKHHPAFTPKVARYDVTTRQFRWIEVSQEQPASLHSDTNLKYPHDKHLDPKGIKSPTGKKVLGCDYCHEPDASGVSFKPIDMQKHCSECHRLDFDPDQPDRLLPHGQPVQVMGVIRDFYARAALAGGVTKPGAPQIVQLIRRPGEQLAPPQARAALEWADQQSALVIDETFDKRVCGYCHTVHRTGDSAVPWSVEPVALGRHQLDAAKFSHAAHRAEKCDSCHAAATSKLSSDLLLPDIKRCRDCHGDPGSSSKIQSPCIECHGYHIAKETLMDGKLRTAAAQPAPPSAAEGKP